MRTNATDSIYNYINIISFLEQIETGLFDADMRLCAVKDNWFSFWECAHSFHDPGDAHGEWGLIEDFSARPGYVGDQFIGGAEVFGDLPCSHDRDTGLVT